MTSEKDRLTELRELMQLHVNKNVSIPGADDTRDLNLKIEFLLKCIVELERELVLKRVWQ